MVCLGVQQFIWGTFIYNSVSLLENMSLVAALRCANSSLCLQYCMATDVHRQHFKFHLKLNLIFIFQTSKCVPWNIGVCTNSTSWIGLQQSVSLPLSRVADLSVVCEYHKWKETEQSLAPVDVINVTHSGLKSVPALWLSSGVFLEAAVASSSLLASF